MCTAYALQLFLFKFSFLFRQAASEGYSANMSHALATLRVQAGLIQMVKMKNLRCHSNLVVQLGATTNFIIGCVSMNGAVALRAFSMLPQPAQQTAACCSDMRVLMPRMPTARPRSVQIEW